MTHPRRIRSQVGRGLVHFSASSSILASKTSAENMDLSPSLPPRERLHPRQAFSLLEVILALAILAGAVAVLGQLGRSGLENARLARDLTLAQLYCESKMAEIAAGLSPVDAQEGVPFEDTDEPAADWTYTVEVNPTGQDGLLEVRVIVSQDPAVEIRPVEYSLVRWMADPEATNATE